MKTNASPGTFARPTPHSLKGTLLEAAGMTAVVALLALAVMYPLVAALGLATTLVAVTVARGLLAARRTRRARSEPAEPVHRG